ncbi:hypothetical protein CVIRNUC_000006 [Coccomyxa viridis]|uniref:Uncharacterized protein n=1 Tax=Coccomyxa viridis TaxID=1274662 RepID=A0AAV1HRH0_9CHLO|nr:hypothetical protein CVIRNUC_000006 [Coccomyxa viridis]
MDPVERRLEKLDSEIADLTAKTEAAWDAFISATDPQRKTELKERYIVLNKEKEDCRSERHDLQLKLPSSGPAESSVWDKHGRCEQLASFLAALPAAQAAIENPRAKTVIGLEGGAIWLGMSTVATADLFVRNCYLELFEARESYIKAANWEHGCQIVFTGTPGVGKSHAAALFVAQKLLAGLCVLLETCWPGRESQRQYFWLSLSGKVERTVNTDAAGVRLNENKGRAIYVTDGCVPCISLALYDGHNVTFCSPQRDLWRRERKALPFKGFYVPVLNEDEVLAMKAALPHYKDLTDDSVSEWFSWAGGSARACLKINKDCGSAGLAAWTSDIKDLLGNISTDGLLAMIRCDGLDTYVESSDRIFHWVLAEGLSEPKACSPQAFRLRRYTKKCVRFASRKIKDLALITLDLSKLADVALACLDDSQQSTGYWVELLSFRCLQGGCKLHGAMLPERHTEGRIPFQISLPPATVEHWTIPMEAAQQSKSDLSVLCLPHSKNEPAIDAISGPALYWQVNSFLLHRRCTQHSLPSMRSEAACLICDIKSPV